MAQQLLSTWLLHFSRASRLDSLQTTPFQAYNSMLYLAIYIYIYIICISYVNIDISHVGILNNKDRCIYIYTYLSHSFANYGYISIIPCTDLPFIPWLGLLAPWPRSCSATGCSTREPWRWSVALPETYPLNPWPCIKLP